MFRTIYCFYISLIVSLFKVSITFLRNTDFANTGPLRASLAFYLPLAVTSQQTFITLSVATLLQKPLGNAKSHVGLMTLPFDCI